MGYEKAGSSDVSDGISVNRNERRLKDARRGPLPGGMSGPQPWYESHRRRRSTMASWFIAISKAVNCKNSEWPGIPPLITTDGSMYRMKAVIELFCHTLTTTWSIHRCCPHRPTETREGSKRQRLNKPENDLRGYFHKTAPYEYRPAGFNALCVWRNKATNYEHRLHY